MKSIHYFLILVCLPIIACNTASFEEKIDAVISSEVGEGVYYEITKIDTITMTNIQNAQLELDTARNILEEQAINLPKQVDETMKRIEKAQAEAAKANGFFKETWENLVLQEEVTLQRLKNLQLGNEIRLEEVKKQTAFIEKMVAQAKGDLVYYTIDAKVGSDTTRYYISPTFELIEE